MALARIRLVARLGAWDSPLPPYVLGSLLAHFLFVLAILLVPSLRSRPRLLDNNLVVEMVASLPGRPRPAPPAPAASKPQPPRVEAQRPKPQPKLQLPDPAKKAVPKKQAAPVLAEPEPEEPPGESSPSSKQPAGTSQPVGDTSSSVAALELGGTEYAWYRNSVSAALYGSWRKPLLDGIREIVQVEITFEILSDGTVRGIEVAETSGVPSLDRSALRAVSDAAPLPALPRSLRESGLKARFVFRLLPEDL